MKTRADVQAAVLEMRKSVEKVARCIDQAARATSPGNAELMRSLHQAQDSLSAARRALQHAAGTAFQLGEKLLGLLPADAEQAPLRAT